MSEDDLQITTIRLREADLKRAEGLIPRLKNVAEFSGIGKIKRGHVLRVAMLRGLEALEREFGGE